MASGVKLGARTEDLRRLLHEMLSCILRARDAPLGSRIDGVAIAAASLGRCLGSSGADPWPAPDELAAALDAIVDAALDDPPPAPSSSIASPCGPAAPRGREAAARCSDDAIRGLAAWLERLHEAARGVDPSAIAVLALRLDGRDDREIACRVDLGLRLVKRLVRELRAAAGGRARCS